MQALEWLAERPELEDFEAIGHVWPWLSLELWDPAPPPDGCALPDGLDGSPAPDPVPPPPEPSGGPPPLEVLGLVWRGVRCVGYVTGLTAALLCCFGAGEGVLRDGTIPGGEPKPGGALPNATPPGAHTLLASHAVDGESSLGGVGLISWPLMHLGPVRLDAIELDTLGIDALSNSSWRASCRTGISGRFSSCPRDTSPNNSHSSSPDSLAW